MLTTVSRFEMHAKRVIDSVVEGSGRVGVDMPPLTFSILFYHGDNRLDMVRHYYGGEPITQKEKDTILRNAIFGYLSICAKGSERLEYHKIKDTATIKRVPWKERETLINGQKFVGQCK